ncbi:Ribosome association toxin PasT (RatA) of the RatAB toxin-antitoxin module [Marinobacter daqiaonensis]|uniref:Ribosome association toxin PasT (RatA) of the RatAB toxin-antitoxin module n=1 Tax=Marinobacter daqiaonensis TaxID=650891 RepID=A0A1I6HXK9_9GAMM|nr:type II toxin-antitoxin system RatA family toxin [Marinobacter daqiaonensis]SFR59205.1 Ribosome association toxin PasT (RatA) of the RatAB toxin-antitoxin module [Marinobacter daqiaonensis]
MPHQIDKSALVLHSAERMFFLVDDVGSYPQFLPWCAGAEVHERTEAEVIASLEVAKGGMRHRLTTRNLRMTPERIDMQLVDGPFRNLKGHWHFKPLDEVACKVILQLEFDFSGPLSRMTFGPVFSQAANTMVEAFCRRADEVYPRSSGSEKR